MFRNLRRYAVFTLLILALGAFLTACEGTTTINTTITNDTATVAVDTTPTTQQNGRGPQGQGQGQQAAGALNPENGEMSADAILALPSGDLSDDEKASLLYMREEEKLAHDVYIALYEKWGLPVFSNIAESEQRHTDMVLALIQKYGLEDPAAGKAAGEFTNPDLQALYDQLVALGSQSEADALKVGAAIEEIDILDLKARIDQTDNEDIRIVYENLMAGSENHLRSFVQTLEQQTGETYQPQYLDQATYDAIMSGTTGQHGEVTPGANGNGEEHGADHTHNTGGPANGGEGAMDVNTLPGGDLTDEERDGLLYMREEEKLAHDVYIALYEKWGLPIFSNIAQSEQQHTDMVLGLIQKYGLEDPAAGKAPGEFTNPDLQALYDQLVAQGSQSVGDALKVGAAIEEIDILDLKARIAQTDNEDIRTVYENLMAGSENHLRAFVQNLQQQTGETYQPQYLDQATYDAIISSPMGHGNAGGTHGHGNGNH